MRVLGLPLRFAMALVFSFSRIVLGFILGCIDYEIVETMPQDLKWMWRFVWNGDLSAH